MIANPGKIANLDLFDGIRTKTGTAQWKGCVEARPEPFDGSDDPPNPMAPRTLFTPCFWPDEPGNGKDNNSLVYANNDMDDGDMPPPAGPTAGNGNGGPVCSSMMARTRT